MGTKNNPRLDSNVKWPPIRSSIESEGEVRYLDRSPNGEYFEVISGRGRTEISYVGENGWLKNEPTVERLMKSELQRILSLSTYGSLYRASMETIHQTTARLQAAADPFSAPREDKHRIFAPSTIGTLAKPLMAIDIIEESIAAAAFRQVLERIKYEGPPPLIYGEESLLDPDLDFTHEDRAVVLMDSVDGTDQVEQGAPGWCSSISIYDPVGNRILASFVGLHDRTIYFAIEGFVGKCRFHDPNLSVCPSVRHLSGPSGVTKVANGLITFYGHKPARLDRLSDDIGHRSLVRKMAESARARIESQAGQPAMMRLVDKVGTRQVDAVVELLGQKAHDVVAGLHIAEMGGAVLTDIDGFPVDLTCSFRRPADRKLDIRYVLAASHELSAEICTHTNHLKVPSAGAFGLGSHEVGKCRKGV